MVAAVSGAPAGGTLLERVGDGLEIGGIPVGRLAERVGGTPFFAYDRGLITRRATAVRAALPPDVELGHPVRANPMPAVLHHLAGLVDTFDVASGRELRRALDTALPPESIALAGPGKSTAELRQAVAAGVTVVLESPTELARVREVAEWLGLPARVAPRVAPVAAAPAGRAAPQPGRGTGPLAVDDERLPALLAEIAASGLDPVGFHVLAAAPRVPADVAARARRATVEHLLRLSETLPGPLRRLHLGYDAVGYGLAGHDFAGYDLAGYDPADPIDLGAPLGVPREPAELAEELADELAELTEDQLRRRQPGARIVLGLGHVLVGEAGVYLTRVVDRRESRGTTFLVVDGALHHPASAVGAVGQVIRRAHPVAVAERAGPPGGRRPETVTVVGRLCTPLDPLGDQVTLPRAEIGDLIAVFQVGAHGLTSPPGALLGHPEPIEVLV